MDLTEDISSWRVLAVDDEPDNLDLIVDLLRFSGAEATRAENGEQALARVEDFHPNIILLDLAMPDLDGWEVHRQLRSDAKYDPVVIIALTAMAMPEDAERVHAAGFDSYVTKPFRVKALLATLSECIRNHAQRESGTSSLSPTKNHSHA